MSFKTHIDIGGMELRNTYKKIFSILCMVLLVFTTIAPSLATANETNPVHSIKIETGMESGDHTRTIQYGYGVLLPEKSEDNYGSQTLNTIPVTYNFETQSLTFEKDGPVQFDIAKNYRFAWVVEYLEGEEQYYYYNEFDATGADILLKNSIAIPEKAKLKGTKINNDVNDFQVNNFQINVGLESVYETTNIESNLHTDSTNLVMDSDTTNQLQFNLIGTTIPLSETATNHSNYLIVNKIDFSKTDNNMSDYIADLIHVTWDTTAEFVHITNEDKNIVAYLSKDSYISNGNYTVQYYNDSSWVGNVTIGDLKDQTITLPDLPNELTVNVTNQFNSSTSLGLEYEVLATNGDFKLEYIGNNTVPTSSKLLLDSKEIAKWDSNYKSNYHEVQMGTNPSGTYILETSMNFGEEVISAKAEVNYNSAWQDLKGTVITAEKADGTPLLGAEATLYELTNGNVRPSYKQLIRETSKTTATNPGEIFIPDAYILKDQEYLLVVKNSADKIAYFNKFIGQTTNNIHLEGTDLNSFKLLTGDLKTTDTSVRLVDSINETEFAHGYFLDPEWKLSSDLDTVLSWSGESSDAEIGYEWSGLVDLNKDIDLTKVEWFSHRPASIYSKASLLVHSESIEKYGEIKSNYYKHYSRPSVVLEVVDGDTIYKGSVYHHGSSELMFAEYTGSVSYKQGTNSLQTNYIDKMRNRIEVVPPTPMILTYDLFNENQEIVESDLVTNSLYQIEIPTALEVGDYVLKLKDTTLNESIVNLKMDTTFTVSEETQKSLSIPVETVTPYGNLSSDQWENRLIISKKVKDYYNYFAELNYNSALQTFESSFMNGSIEKTAEYYVFATVTLENSETKLVQSDILTGEQLLAFNMANSYKFSDDLVKYTVDNVAENTRQSSTQLLWKESIPSFYSDTTINSNSGKIEFYASQGNYEGKIIIKEEKARKLIDIPSFELKTDTIFTLNTTNLAEIKFLNQNKELPMFGISMFENNFHMHEYDELITSQFMSKKTYKDFAFMVGLSDSNDTPWGYKLSQENVNLTDNKEYNFSREITGEIDSINVYEDKTLNIFMNLTSDEFKVEEIYHATKNKYSFLNVTNLEDSPIREYYGLFNDMNNVSITLTIKDSLGNVISTQTNNQYHLSYMYHEFDEALEKGTYTAHINIPTGPKKSLKLEEKFTIGGEAGPFVTIDSPSNDFATKDTSVTVSGTATADATLVATLKNGSTTVETKNVTTSAEGIYEVEFSPKTDGDYIVEVANGDVKDSATFTIDRTAPEKATDIAFVESTNGLTVSWTGATDAAQYKVEVAEGTNEFTTVQATQTALTYTITNVKPGTTYKVRITSIDAVGNESISDEASHSIDPFATTGITLEDKRNTNGFLVIGDELKVTLEGSYDENYVGKAIVIIDDESKEIELTYNTTNENYEGKLTIIAGMNEIQSITGFIQNGTEKTNEKEVDLNWTVGSTITGSVSDGEAVSNAVVRFKNETASFSATTKEDGTYEFKGIAAGEYTITVTLGNRTYSKGLVNVTVSEVKSLPVIDLPAFTNPVFNFVDNIDKEALEKDGLPVRIEGPNKFTVYGSTKDGKFLPYSGTTLKDLETGEYKVTVFGEGLFETTIKEISLTKETDYTIEVTKINVVEKDITITLPEELTKVDSISLYSPSLNEQFNYSGIGSYYEYETEVVDNKIVLKDVVLAEDYILYVAADGYISYNNQTVDLTATQSITVELLKGREITGKVTDSKGALGLVHVYAYAGNTYYSTQTDGVGNFTLKGLSKTEDVTIGVYSQIHISEQVTIEKGNDDTIQNIQLSKAASLTGTVVDKDGKVMANVQVSAYGEDSYGWARTDSKGFFSVNGLVDTKTYDLEFSAFGYPNVKVSDQKVGEVNQHTLQKIGDGNFNGEGNFFASSKSTVVPGDKVQFTLAYQNNGKTTASNVPVTLVIPAGLTLINETIQLNGKVVPATNNVITIPTIEVGEEGKGKITFEATVKTDVTEPSLTATAKVTPNGNILSASTSVVFVTLEAPAQTGSTSVKVYGNAKYGSTIEIYANNKLVGQTKVDSKWWYSDIKLPVKDTAVEEEFTITAKVTSGSSIVNSKPVIVSYTPDVPTLTDVTVHAGWNGDVNLNPYTGVATFAIVEHTPLDTEIQFDPKQEVDSAKLLFLGETYDMTKGANNTFTFNGSELGKWTSYGEQLLEVTFKKGDVEITMPLMNIIVLIDPSGFVFEGSMDNKLEGVQAIVETQDANQNWIKWDAVKFGQINPQVTDSEGRYGWDVITGKWRVIFTKVGYEPYISRVMDVPPPETELNIPMVKIGDPSILTTSVTGKDLSITFDRFMNVVNKNDHLKLYEVKDGERIVVAGSVTTVDKAAYKSINTPADKETGFIGQDSNNEDGFFEVDSSKSVSKTFTFVPEETLKAGTEYVLVVNENIQDTEKRILGATSEFEFTTDTISAPTNPGTGGGGTPPPATTSPEVGEVTVDPTTGAQEVMVDEKKLEEQIAKETEQVILDLSN